MAASGRRFSTRSNRSSSAGHRGCRHRRRPRDRGAAPLRTRGYQPTWLTLSRFEAREPGPEAGAGLVERYLALLSDPDTQPDALRAVLHPDARQIEHPNAINPTGQERDLQRLLDGVVRGRTLLTSQRFDVIGHVSHADEIMTRAYWTGTLASGAALTARFAMHFTLRDGLIWRQENYDCFDPLPDVGAAGS